MKGRDMDDHNAVLEFIPVPKLFWYTILVQYRVKETDKLRPDAKYLNLSLLSS